jgi:hypothetical protein
MSQQDIFYLLNNIVLKLTNPNNYALNVYNKLKNHYISRSAYKNHIKITKKH